MPPPPLNPPSGGHFPSNRMDGQEHIQQHHNHGFSRSPPLPHSSPHANSTPLQKRSESRSKSGPTLPPKPPAGVVSHPLPPKPPKSHDQINQHHDHRNKRKNDRHNKGRDRRHSNEQNHNQRKPNPGPHRDSQPQRSAENRRSSGSRRGQRQNHGGSNAKKQPSAAVASDNPLLGSKGRDGDRRPSSHHAAPPPSPVEQTDRKVDEDESPPKPVSSFVEGSETYANEMTNDGRENEKGSEVSNTYVHVENPEDSDRRSLSDYHGGSSSKHSADQDSKSHEREAKRPRLEISAKGGTDIPDVEEGEECLWNTLDVPREAERRQQMGRDHAAARRRGSGGSRASRHSSPSIQSSDLNSLEAELLGRPAKQKSSEKSNTRHRGENLDKRLIPKRRRANTNSAYSRRW